MFFEDAIKASRVLEITLTSRNSDQAGKAIPMCGIPYHAVDGYLVKLLKQGYKVAICDQTEDAKKAKGLVRREVTRVVTPGMPVQEGVLDASENNYVASLLEMEGSVGAAFLECIDRGVPGSARRRARRPGQPCTTTWLTLVPGS